VIRAAGLDDQPVGEGAAADHFGEPARRDVDALHHAAALEPGIGDHGGDAAEPIGDDLRLAGDFVHQRAVEPELFERDAGRDEGVLVAAEGAVVLGRPPDVVLGLDQQQRHRQTEAGDRLRHGDEIGHNAGGLEGEE
jgi:hypothetical protein